ncbi:MAG: nucleotidyltransferase family protein [Burkholderiaceae bacterium]|nr:nucleotidyltransferase family protein [Burkholderiaceae bacterium]
MSLLWSYRSPESAAQIAPARWTEIIGAARRTRSLGHLAHRLERAGVLESLDPKVAGHMRSAQVAIRHWRALLRWELDEIAHALAPGGLRLVLLKGAAYEVAGLPLSSARAAGDVDLLVPSTTLRDVELRMRECGWDAQQLSVHDEHYYRDLSHEIPPLSHPERGIEVDVHHAITPSLRGTGVDTSKLFAASVPIEFNGHRLFRVLQPVDQLIHCAIHTFKDSDLTLRLRETMDFDLLYRHYRELDPDLDDRLVVRARELGLPRPLWWSIHFARRWLGSPIPERTLRELPRPSGATVHVMNWLCDRAMLPGLRLERGGLDRLAAVALLARYHRERMPVSQLVPHLLRKSKQRIMQPKVEPGGP